MRKSIISGILTCTVFSSGLAPTTAANAQPTNAGSEPASIASEAQQSASLQEITQNFAKGSTVPASFHPIDLARRELEGSSMMSSGSSTGDVALSARGMGQALLTLGTVFLAVTLLGQAVEWIMRGLRIVRR